MDYAFVILYPNYSGHNAGDYTGTVGFLANAPLYQRDYHLGYPLEGPWRQFCGQDCRPWYCLAPIQRYDQYYGGGFDEGMSCLTSGGASGGPILQYYNGRWYIASVLSHMGVVHPWNGERYGISFFGPYLDNTTISL